MSGKWFTNRGQIGQLIVATLALVVGVIIAWPQLSPHMNLFQLWPIIVAPLTTFAVFQAGRKSSTTSLTPASTTLADEINNDVYRTTVEVFEPQIRVGSFWEAGGIRITAAAIQKGTFSDVESPGVRLVLRGGSEGQFTSGRETKRLDYNEFLVPLSSTGVEAEKTSVFSFGSLTGYIYLTIIRVEHINESGQEVSLSIYRLKSTNKKRLLTRLS